MLFLTCLLAACQPAAGSSPTITDESPSQTPSAQDATSSISPWNIQGSVFASVRITYSDQQQLWVWEKGAAEAIAGADSTTRPRFSSDGAYIAFLKGGNLLVIGSNGKNEKVLMSADGLSALRSGDPERSISISWIPGKHYLVISTLRSSNMQLIPDLDVHLMNTDDGEWKTVFSAGQGGIVHPSPDGEWLAVVSSTRTLVMRYDGSQQQELITYPPFVQSNLPYFPNISWSEDSKYFLLEIRSLTTSTIWCVPLTDVPFIELETEAFRGLTFSPDLSNYVYTFEEDDLVDSPIELHIASINGSSDQIYFAGLRQDYGGINFMGWSPDSSSFVFRDTQGNMQWIDLEHQTTQFLSSVPLPPPFIQEILWPDVSHVLILQVSLGEMWLTTTGKQRLRVVQLTDENYLAALDAFDMVKVH